MSERLKEKIFLVIDIAFPQINSKVYNGKLYNSLHLFFPIKEEKTCVECRAFRYLPFVP